jgi:Flp pilus assembly CpaF family ATPase
MNVNIFQAQKLNLPATIEGSHMVSEIIEYLLTYHQDVIVSLKEEEKSKKVLENIITDKLIKDKTYMICDYDRLVKQVFDYFFGYSLIQKHIDDEMVTDIRMINKDTIWVRKKGKWELSDVFFGDDSSYDTFIRYCVLKNGGVIN